MCLMFISCNYNDKTTENKKIQPEYIKAEVYCFCLNEIQQNYQTLRISCSTTASVRPYELINANELFYSTNDTMIIKRLKNFFFDKREKIDTLIQGSDARFVVLLKKNDLSTDTLVFNNEYSFNFNEKYKFNYSFQIMDSIKSILNKKTLTCP